MRIDKNNPEFMKEYLKQVVTFEKQVYIWENSLNTVNQKCSSLCQEKNTLIQKRDVLSRQIHSIDENIQKDVIHSKNEIKKLKKGLKKKKIIKICLVVAIILGVILFFSGPLNIFDDDFESKITNTQLLGIAMALISVGWLLVVTVSFDFWDKLFGGYTKDELLKEHEKRIQQNYYAVQGSAQKQEMDNEISRINKDIIFLNSQIDITEQNKSRLIAPYQEAKKILSDIYAMNVLPEKYRSLNAVATLYEYLENGICTTVMGHGGIYDTYEYHIRMGIIIAKMDDILRKLDSIIDNQNYLYREICECNEKMSKIDNDIMATKQAFDAYSAASIELQAQTYAEVAYYNWKNS